MAKTNPTPEQEQNLSRAQKTTLAALSQIDEQQILQLTELTLPEIREIREEIARVLPAGNLPAMIVSSLTQIKGRKVNPERARKDINTLMRGIQLLPQGLFGVLIGGPSLILYTYQKILQLAGKDASSAFPQGTWQFYLEFGLREDTARHANETIGFQARFPGEDNIAARATAWGCTAMDLIYQYDDLLATDWRERVMLRIVVQASREAKLADKPPFSTLIKDWNKARPYHCPPNRADYLRYRLETFEVFLQSRLQKLSQDIQTNIREQYAARQQTELSDFQQQMTILSALTPDQHQEHKTPIPLWRAALGFVWKGHTYMLPACQRNTEGSPLCYPPDSGAQAIPLYAREEGVCDAQGNVLETDRGGHVWYLNSKKPLGNLRPPTRETIYGWIQAIMNNPPNTQASELDLLLVECPRNAQQHLREILPETTKTDLAILRRAPIIINWDKQTHKLLSYIRRGHRGIGDHALTIFNAGKSIVFDQSHIFFDGMWGMATSEIATEQAIKHYQKLIQSTPTQQTAALSALKLSGIEKLANQTRKYQRRNEAAAESLTVNLRNVSELRRRLKERGVRLTINDLLLLHRVRYAQQYSLSETVKKELLELQNRAKRPKYNAVRQTIEQNIAHSQETNPAMLIPMDASNVTPQERLYPTTFRNPITDLPEVYTTAMDSYHAYQENHTPQAWDNFQEKRKQLLSTLNYFGEFLDALKGLTMRGESSANVTLRLLGHLPPAMQHMLDQIPQKIGVLNEVVKGNEVFSNVGRVARGSTLNRFISAKDDGVTKELVWGILTNDKGRMHISLRDFRPFIPMLLEMGEPQLADLLARDYLDGYVDSFNNFISELSGIVAKQATIKN